MYSNAPSCVHVNGSFSEPFKALVGVHHRSVLSPLFFIIVMEALQREFRVSSSWEFYVNNLGILNDSLVDLKNRLAA